jgi:barbiturase
VAVTSAHKVVLGGVSDTTELEKLIGDGLVDPDSVVAIIGKTEGNGGINDFTRILADQAYRGALYRLGTRTAEQVADIPMVWSGGCDGVLCPHATVFCRYEMPSSDEPKGGPPGRLTVGTALSDQILPEDIGRRALVAKVADAVRVAMADAGITDPGEVHWVQTKAPLLTVSAIAEAANRGQSVANEDVHRSMDLSNGTVALGIALALGEIDGLPPDEAIGRDLSLFSWVASCSSGVELDRVQVVLLGNSEAAGGALRAGHSAMADALDQAGIYRAIADAGLDLPVPERPLAADVADQVVNVFLKCEADARATLRGRRQLMLDDSDVHHHRQIKAAVGGIAAAAVGDPAVFVSVGALHQGPPGGGPVMAIVRLPEDRP